MVHRRQCSGERNAGAPKRKELTKRRYAREASHLRRNVPRITTGKRKIVRWITTVQTRE